MDIKTQSLLLPFDLNVNLHNTISKPKYINKSLTFVDAERSGRPSVITEAMKQKVNRIIRENRHFTISEVYEKCPEVSRTIVYEIVTEHLQYRKICARWVARRPSGTRRE